MIVLAFDLTNGTASFVQSNTGSVQVIRKVTEGSDVILDHLLHHLSYRPGFLQRKVEFEFVKAVRKLSFPAEGLLYDIVEHSKMPFIEKEGRLSHLLPRKGKLFLIILSKAGFEQRGEAVLISTVAEKVHDNAERTRSF